MIIDKVRKKQLPSPKTDITFLFWRLNRSVMLKCGVDFSGTDCLQCFSTAGGTGGSGKLLSLAYWEVISAFLSTSVFSSESVHKTCVQHGHTYRRMLGFHFLPGFLLVLQSLHCCSIFCPGITNCLPEKTGGPLGICLAALQAKRAFCRWELMWTRWDSLGRGLIIPSL